MSSNFAAGTFVRVRTQAPAAKFDGGYISLTVGAGVSDTEFLSENPGF